MHFLQFAASFSFSCAQKLEVNLGLLLSSHISLDLLQFSVFMLPLNKSVLYVVWTSSVLGIGPNQDLFSIQIKLSP
jgi:hypothetical protein